MTKTAEKERTEVRPGVYRAPSVGVDQNRAPHHSHLREAHISGFWWVETEEEAVQMLAWEVSK